ncbi:GPI-N-acetylgalactosamine transferase PGAP4 [Lampetra fluviatilis]
MTATVRRRAPVLRSSRNLARVAALFALTFLVVLPLSCRHLRYSHYSDSGGHVAQAQDEAQAREDALDAERARRFLRRIATEDDVPRRRRHHGNGTRGEGPGDLAVAVVSVRRQEPYLSRVVARLLALLRACGPACERHRLLVCNVQAVPEDHIEAGEISALVHTVARFSESDPDAGKPPAHSRFEKEKRDYTWCLRRAATMTAGGDGGAVVLLEDDALPADDFFPVLHHLLGERRAASLRLRRALYVKLFHPERLQGYLNPEPMRILEWVGAGGLCGLALMAVYLRLARTPFRWRLVAALALYAMLCVEMVGRHYFLELRRASPHFYALAPATECCTPAMAFPSAAAALAVAELLDAEQCAPKYGKDMALYAAMHRAEHGALVLEPNLVRHIGRYSSLRS